MLAPYRQKIIDYVKPLTVWQKLYFFAFFILLFEFIFGSEPTDYSVAGAVALAALSIEVWPKFVKLWESIIGRVIVISIYIVVGNFAVAAAGHHLNSIVGIDPGNLFYATGFVSILMAPIWIITITLIGMLIYVVVRYLWFLLTLVPWLIGLYEKSSYGVEKLPKTTRVVKIIMLPVMFISLVSVLELYNDTDAFITGVKEGWEMEKSSSEQAASEEVGEDGLDNAPATPEIEKKDEITLEDGEFTINGKPVEGWQRGHKMDKLIASFVYYLEGFQYSHCEKTEQERVASLGEFDILAIEPDDSELGYRFTVRPCKLKSYETSQDNPQ